MEALERSVSSTDWITLVFLLSLLCLVFTKSMFEGRFFSFIILPFNNKYIFLYNKKGRLLHGFHLVQSLFLLLNLSLFLLLAFPAFPEIPPVSNAVLLLLAFAGLLAFFLAKLGLQLVVGLLFDLETLIAELIYKKMTYLNYSSLVMFGANLLLAYVWPASKPVVFLSVFLILLINLIGWAGILKIHQKLITSYFFYFILYLCALELAPFLIIAYLLKD
jgi:hypothetical protein